MVAGGSRNSLSGQVAPAAGLEADDDVSDLQVPFLLQVGQHAGPEEDFTLADAVQIAVELQGFDLDGGEQAVCGVPPRSPQTKPGAGLSQGSGRETGQSWSHCFSAGQPVSRGSGGCWGERQVSS